MKIRKMKIIAVLISALGVLALLASCEPFDIGNLRSVEKAKAAALKTLEERYGVPFEFADDDDGEPLDMETYMHWDTKSSFYEVKHWGQEFKPQRLGWQEGLFPIRVMNGLVRPAGEKETDAFHTYKVNVYANSVSDGAYGYLYEDEIKRRIMEVWEKRPKDFPFLDKIKIEVRTEGIRIPENIRSMSLDEFCPIAYDQSLFAFRIRIYLYLPADGYWGKLQNEFVSHVVRFKDDPPELRGYRFSDEDWRTPNRRLEKEMEVLEKAVGKLYELLKAEPSLSQFVEKKSFVFSGRLDDHFLGTHNVLGTDVFNCIGEKINTMNSRFSAGIGYWDMPTAIDEWTYYNYDSRMDVLWHRPEETDKDNGLFDMSWFSGNWHGRLGITWVERHRKPKPPAEPESAEENPADGANPSEKTDGNTSETGKKTADGEDSAKNTEVAENEEPPVEYDDGIDESLIIEKEDHSDWVCLDGSAVDWVLFLQCHRPTTGIIEFRNGYTIVKEAEDYSRLKKVLVTNRVNGKSKTVTLADTFEIQKIDLRDITEPQIVMNVYELRILDVYPGKKYEAAGVSYFNMEIAEAPDGR